VNVASIHVGGEPANVLLNLGREDRLEADHLSTGHSSPVALLIKATRSSRASNGSTS